MKNKIKTYRIVNVEEFLTKITWGNDLFEAISCDYDEDEASLDWGFNPSPEPEELEDAGAKIVVHREDDLPINCWGCDITGDPHDVAENLARTFIGDSIDLIPDSLFDYIKGQYYDSLPAFN